MTLEDILEIKEFITNMRKLSESIWSDIQDRSAGESVRKEDDVNYMNPEDFCDFLNDNYIYKNKHKIHYDEIGKRFCISVLKKFENVNYTITYDYNTNTLTEWRFPEQ